MPVYFESITRSTSDSVNCAAPGTAEPQLRIPTFASWERGGAWKSVEVERTSVQARMLEPHGPNGCPRTEIFINQHKIHTPSATGNSVDCS